MVSKNEKDKLRALNLIGQTIEVQTAGSRLFGQVFYFNEKVLILKKDQEYIFINVSNFEELQINCKLSSRGSVQLR